MTVFLRLNLTLKDLPCALLVAKAGAEFLAKNIRVKTHYLRSGRWKTERLNCDVPAIGVKRTSSLLAMTRMSLGGPPLRLYLSTH
jgi:hypothetical protein